MIFTLAPEMQKNESNSAERIKNNKRVRKEKASVENVKAAETSEIMVLKLNNHLVVGSLASPWRRVVAFVTTSGFFFVARTAERS